MILACLTKLGIRSVTPSLLRVAALAFLLTSVSLASAAPSPAAEAFTVTVTGIDGRMQENVEAALAIPHGMVRNGRVEPVWARSFTRQAQNRAARALEPFGYYDPEVTTELVQDKGKGYHLTVKINLGEPVRVSHRSVTIAGPGADQARLKGLVDAFPLPPGAELRHDLYEESKGELLATATALGYLDAHFVRHDIRLSREARQAEINLDLETGPQYTFGEITFHGAQNFPRSVLRRYLTFSPGKPFIQSKLAQTQANLFDADKFRTARVIAERSHAQGSVIPVQIELEPMPQYQLRPGLGYGTDSGPRASLRFRDSNTLHLGHELQTDLLIAQGNQSISGRYMIPLTKRIDSLMAFSALYNRDNNDTFDSQSLATEASLTYGLAKGYKATFFINLSQESYQVGEGPSRDTTLVMPGFRLGQRRWKFDSPGQPRSGYSWQTEIRGSSASLGSDISMLQLLIGGSSITPLPWASRLLLHAEGGTTLQDNFDDMPASMRFFAGGDQSVRGYAYKSLGPKDDNGDVIGGRHLAVASVELEKQVSKEWSLALFYDAGNAFDDLNAYELAHGTGFGVRRHTPIGPIKLDLARQLGETDNAYRIHLSIGFTW